jgi:hypothetical protein
MVTLAGAFRGLDDEKKARMGVVECQSHGLVEAYPVMFEKDGMSDVGWAAERFVIGFFPRAVMRLCAWFVWWA